MRRDAARCHWEWRHEFGVGGYGPVHCRRSPAPGAPRGKYGPEVRYDCSGFPANPDGQACEPPPAWLTTMESFGTFVLDPGVTRPTAAQCDEAREALAQAKPLSIVAQVVAQNAAFRLFVAAPFHCTLAGEEGIAKAAARAVERLALPSDKLATLAAPGLDAWLGPSSEWRDMVTGDARSKTKSTLFHDQADEHTRIFRPLRSGKLRAIFSRIIAIDRT